MSSLWFYYYPFLNQRGFYGISLGGLIFPLLKCCHTTWHRKAPSRGEDLEHGENHHGFFKTRKIQLMGYLFFVTGKHVNMWFSHLLGLCFFSYLYGFLYMANLQRKWTISMDPFGWWVNWNGTDVIWVHRGLSEWATPQMVLGWRPPPKFHTPSNKPAMNKGALVV